LKWEGNKMGPETDGKRNVDWNVNRSFCVMAHR
jgi:hypothetical protein